MSSIGVPGTAIVTIMGKGDKERVEEYRWEVPPMGDWSISSSARAVAKVTNLLKPVFTHGTFSHPAWGGNFAASFRNCPIIKLYLPYPPGEEGTNLSWEYEYGWVHVGGENHIHRCKVPLLIDSERPTLPPGHSEWSPEIRKVVYATLDSADITLPITFELKIVGKPKEEEEAKVNPRCKKADMGRFIPAVFNNPELSDVKIECGDETILCHKIILSVASPVFKAMFVSDTKEKDEGRVFIEDVKKDILKLMLEWIYGQDIGPKLQTVTQRVDLFKAADRYLLQTLKDSLVTDILVSLNPDSAFDIYALGDTYNDERLKTNAVQVMKREKKRVFTNDQVFADCVQKFPKLVQDILTGD